jgi:hypothetical protein
LRSNEVEWRKDTRYDGAVTDGTMNMTNYRGYRGTIAFDPEDEIHFGNLHGMRDIVGFHAKTVAGAQKRLPRRRR